MQDANPLDLVALVPGSNCSYHTGSIFLAHRGDCKIFAMWDYHPNKVRGQQPMIWFMGHHIYIYIYVCIYIYIRILYTLYRCICMYNKYTCVNDRSMLTGVQSQLRNSLDHGRDRWGAVLHPEGPRVVGQTLSWSLWEPSTLSWGGLVLPGLGWLKDEAVWMIFWGPCPSYSYEITKWKMAGQKCGGSTWEEYWHGQPHVLL